jgi:hypothetical protein
MRHAHFNDRKIVFRFESEQAERESEVIVEIALGAMNAILNRKQVRNGLFGGGLAHRSGDADGRLAPQFSDRGRKGLKGDERVIDRQQVL